MRIDITDADIPRELVGDERIKVERDDKGFIRMLSFSSAPDLPFPTVSQVLTIGKPGSTVRLESTTHALFPDPGDDPSFYEVEGKVVPLRASSDNEAASEEDGQFGTFYEWAMEQLDLIQYHTEVWRQGLQVCSFCQKHEEQVDHVIAGPDGYSICSECVDLCEDVLAEDAQ